MLNGRFDPMLSEQYFPMLLYDLDRRGLRVNFDDTGILFDLTWTLNNERYSL